MARRMFSDQITESDAFMDMPISSQLLYFRLGMRADDAGFVGNPKLVMRLCGANEDDIKVLITKRFVLTFESGVIVIKHWKINNQIRKDRFRETKYLDELSTIMEKENGAYTEKKQLGQPNGNQASTNGVHSIVEDSIGKDSIQNPVDKKSTEDMEKPKNNVQQLVNYYFELKEWDDMPVEFYKENNISYPRHCKRAKELLELCDGNLEKAKTMVDKIKDWADGRGLEWTIETVFKKWMELETNKL